MVGVSEELVRAAGGAGRGRMLLPLVAAASVAAVVVAGVMLTGVYDGAGPRADKAVPVVIADTPEGTVPSVFGHTRTSANALLMDRGLQVRYD